MKCPYCGLDGVQKKYEKSTYKRNIFAQKCNRCK